jgi:competence protein ComEC
MKNYILSLFLIFSLTIQLSAQNVDQNIMKTHYINVGQGDATLLEFPCGVILIDTGAQDDRLADNLINYLEDFFKKRDDLQKTIDLIIITHAHRDHNIALQKVIESFDVKAYIDNGLRKGSGKKNQKWAQDNASDLGIRYGSYSYEEIVAQGGLMGLTNDLIDPLNCDSVDPVIKLLAGHFETRPSNWSRTSYKKGNNQSIIVRVEFEEASFLFTGDMEEKGLETVIEHYGKLENGMLDTDIYQVGHHGSHNATTSDLVEANSPNAAIISCGRWNFGLGANKKYNTYSYGHPRESIIKILEQGIVKNRSQPVSVKVGVKSKSFIDYTIKKRIYATPWDNTIKVRANSNGEFRITRNH